MKYKALFLDVDGTIVPYVHKAMPSVKVRDAIKKASEKVYVCLATGRPYFMLEHILAYLNLTGFVIMNDGAQVMDLRTKTIIYEKVMAKKDVLQACKILYRLKIPIFIHDNHKDFIYTPDYKPVKPMNLFTAHDQKERLIDRAVGELTLLSNLKVNKTHYGTEGEYGILISHASATKLHGIFEVLKLLKINKRQTIGVGDSGNDFPLLMASGLKVAMGNAIEPLKDVADYIAPSVDEDGVAHVIEKFILSQGKTPSQLPLI